MMLRALGYRVGMALVIVLGVWGGYALIIRLAYGAFPALTKMFSSLRVFSVLGFNMLPMPGIHPWNLVALVLLVGMAISLFALLMRSATPRHAMVLLIALQGWGSYSIIRAAATTGTSSALWYMSLSSWGYSATHCSKSPSGTSWPGFPPPCSRSFCWLLLSSRLQRGTNTGAGFRASHQDPQRHRATSHNWNAEFIQSHSRPGERSWWCARTITRPLPRTIAHGFGVQPQVQEMFWRSDYERWREFPVTNRQAKVLWICARAAPVTNLCATSCRNSMR